MARFREGQQRSVAAILSGLGGGLESYAKLKFARRQSEAQTELEKQREMRLEERFSHQSAEQERHNRAMEEQDRTQEERFRDEQRRRDEEFRAKFSPGEYAPGEEIPGEGGQYPGVTPEEYKQRGWELPQYPYPKGTERIRAESEAEYHRNLGRAALDRANRPKTLTRAEQDEMGAVDSIEQYLGDMQTRSQGETKSYIDNLRRAGGVDYQSTTPGGTPDIQFNPEDPMGSVFEILDKYPTNYPNPRIAGQYKHPEAAAEFIQRTGISDPKKIAELNRKMIYRGLPGIYTKSREKTQSVGEIYEGGSTAPPGAASGQQGRSQNEGDRDALMVLSHTAMKYSESQLKDGPVLDSADFEALFKAFKSTQVPDVRDSIRMLMKKAASQAHMLGGNQGARSLLPPHLRDRARPRFGGFDLTGEGSRAMGYGESEDDFSQLRSAYPDVFSQ